MNRSTSVLLLAAALAAVPTASALSWNVQQSSCDGAPFSNLQISVTCSGSSSCGLGDTATVAGSLYATSSFSNADVTLKACAMGYCPEEAQGKAGKVCDDWLSPSDGQECGEVGNYEVYHEEDIPEYDDIPSALEWIVSKTVTVNMQVGSEEECEGEADNAYGMPYGVSYSMAGLVSLALAGAAYAARKRRHGGDEGDRGQGFVEMTDGAVV